MSIAYCRCCFSSNDYTGSSELCTLFLDRSGAKRATVICLSKSRFMFMAFGKFNEKVVAEMRGVIDEHGHSPSGKALGNASFDLIFPLLTFSGARAKGIYCRTDAEHPIYTHFYPRKPMAPTVRYIRKLRLPVRCLRSVPRP
ncbi:arginine N-succinyltransferase [Shigella flexneri]